MIKQRPIYLCVTSFFPTPTSWRCAFVYDQVQAIRRTGRYDVVVINVDSCYDYEYKGILVLGIKGVHRGTFICPPLFDWINNRRLDRAFERRGINCKLISVVHAHLVTTAPFAIHVRRRNPNVKVMVQLHDPDPLAVIMNRPWWDVLGCKRYLYFRRHRALLESVDAVVAISKYVADVVCRFPKSSSSSAYAPIKEAQCALKRCRPAHPKRILLLHNGVDRRIFNIAPCALKESGCFRIGCVANFTESKDQITLIKAARIVLERFPDIGLKVVFVGSGACLQSCKDYVFENGLSSRFEFLTEVDHNALASFYRSLDLFVLPSYFEGLGCVFLESWACGIPFVACSGQGIDDYICCGDESRWLFRARDCYGLASRILAFMKDRSEQRLAAEVDIDKLVPAFLSEMEKAFEVIV